MINYDSTSIYNRAVSRLQQDPDWKPIVNESVISALLKSNAETLAETARYAEYLFKESKWNTAQNESSILAMANMLGYQPKRKISATGKIFISTDPNILLVGKTSSAKDFSNAIKTGNYSFTTYYTNLTIPSTTEISCSNGIKFVPITSKTLLSNLACDSLEIIQGIKKSTVVDIDTIRSTCTKSTINSYLYVPFRINNCENASSILSKKFLKLKVNYTDGKVDEYRIVDSLLLSDSMDKDVELYNDMYDNTLFYAKFNNSPYKGTVLDVSSNSSIKSMQVDYLESLGNEGNVSNLYQNFTFEVSGVKLYGINMDYISGGYDEEDLNSIKENATKYYISSYSIGTKESYEKTILNTEFKVGTYNIKPKKTIVYGGEFTDDTGNSKPVTYVSFLSDGLDDLTYDSDKEERYTQIEEALNYYLSRLKSPQDTVKFAVPNYIPLAIGVNCTLSTSSTTEGTSAIDSSIQTYIDSLWGSNSENISFGKTFNTSNLENMIMNKFSTIESISTEVEAIAQLDLLSSETKLIDSHKSKVGSSTDSASLRTLRIPFSFSSVFRGNKVRKGFKDMRVGASYSMRIDVIYKKPTAISTTNGLYNQSIFIGNYTLDNTLMSSSDDTVAFYAKKDTSGIWGTDNNYQGADYTVLNSITNLSTDINQIKYTQKVYSDTEYDDLRTSIKTGSIKSFSGSTGALDDFLVYFSGNYDENSLNIGDGSYLEIGLDSVYTMLQLFATYADTTLATQLEKCPLATLKCGTLKDNDTIVSTFKEILNKYVTIYVSMRPIDDNLKLSSTVENEDIRCNNQKSILYIDSADSNNESDVEDISSIKYSRMISVNCEYEED